METISSCSSSLGDGKRDIEMLYQAFGSAFSLEAIASAYSQASRNVDMAGALLYDMQEQTSPIDHLSNNVGAASVSSSDGTAQSTDTTDGNVASAVPCNIVSGTCEGQNFKTILSAQNLTSKVGPKESFAMSCSSSWKDGSSMSQDMEEFLFKMLGDGFQLDKKMMHEVLGLCGYDLEKSMEALVDLSASGLGKSDDLVRTAERENYLKVGLGHGTERSELSGSSLRSMNHEGEELCKKKKDKYDLQREIFGSLFNVPERTQEQPKRSVPRNRVVGRSSAFGRPVVEPLEETKIEETFVAIKPLRTGEEEDVENSYHALRQAVNENWALMKEYYKAAAEAYAKGDQARAFKLMKEGQFYKVKALEADEESVQKNLETCCREDEVLLNMSTYTPKEAVKNLRRNLQLFAGIPSTRYLKLTVGNDNAQSRKKGRKQLVLKELEKESIKWSEEDEGKTIVIPLDEVNPNTLSFAKK